MSAELYALQTALTELQDKIKAAAIARDEAQKNWNDLMKQQDPIREAIRLVEGYELVKDLSPQQRDLIAAGNWQQVTDVRLWYVRRVGLTGREVRMPTPDGNCAREYLNNPDASAMIAAALGVRP